MVSPDQEMRVDEPETVEAAPEPKQLELISATPAKKDKADKKKAPTKAKAKAK